MDRLVGVPVPPLRLTATNGHGVDLTAVGDPWGVLYLYGDGEAGCVAFRDHHAELAGLGAEVYGLSSEAPEPQREAVERLQLPFALLSDTRHLLADALDLPTLEADGTRVYERLTLAVRHARVVHVFHPVAEP